MSNKANKESKPRLLYLHNRPSGGGGESLFQMLYENEFWESKVIVFLTNGFLRDKFKLLEPGIEIVIQVGSSWLGTIKGIKWLYIPTRLWDLRRSRGFYKRVKSLVQEKDINLIHSNTINIMIGGYIAKRKGIAHVVQVRELVDLPYYQFPIPKRFVMALVSKLSDRIIANSQRTKTALLNLGVKENKISVIHNTVSKPKEALDIRDYLNLPRDQKTVAVVGWITPNKMLEDFINLAKAFKDRDDVSFLVIGGEGGNKAYNENIRKQADGQSNIIFTGLIQGVTNYMASLDILVCTCYTESFGRTVAEALIAGTPAIGVKDCAVAEIIDHGETGYLTNKSNIEDFVKYTDLLLNEPILRTKMGERAINRMEVKFGLEVIRNKYSELYNELLNQYKHG